MDGSYPDRNYIRTEVSFVTYVRDRKDADIHLLVTEQSGDAGTEFQLEFIGQGRFQDIRFTLKYFADRLATEDKVREGFVRVMKKGLMPFVSRTELEDMLSITFQEKVRPAVARDPWNRWLFNLGLNGSASGEEFYDSRSFRIRASANRVTEEIKIQTSFSTSVDRSHYTYEDLAVTTKTKSWQGGALVVKSLGNHWSVGGWLQASASTYSNIKSLFRIAPAVEYDVFPYSRSTRAELLFLYRLNYGYYRYFEETIYGKLHEGLWSQSLNVILDLTQPWGSASAAVVGSHYFHDVRLNHLVLYGELFVRVWKGFSFNVSGDYQLVHDQLSIVRGTLTDEEILLRLKQLRTTFSYYISLGLSYSFGSVMSRSVNPRFGTGFFY
ncbi:MAG TPA: hypothetical protein VEG35_00725 [Burkholderiales bacterium]|nr:hypothetical protein [Burkholderiales bacterium]